MLSFTVPARAVAVISVAAAALAAAPLAATASSPSTSACPTPTIAVSTAAQLTAALASARPGDVITLADGVYHGKFTANTPATAAKPITVCGSRNAILEAEGPSGGYVLHLDNADYWRIVGITARHGQKGIMLDDTDHAIIQGVEVYDTGDEAIHLRKFSSYNLVTGAEIHDTGRRNTKFGEGIYVGSAQSNWSSVSGGVPDESHYNVIENNTIYRTTAESVDIKEGTQGGVLRGNHFDGALLVTSGADSWVDVKGRDWLIENNTGVNSPMDGFQTHKIVNGWGTGNVFSGNVAEVKGPGFGIALTPVLENVVTCDNVVVSAAEGYANVDCTGQAPAPVVTPAPEPEPEPEPVVTPEPAPAPVVTPEPAPAPVVTPEPAPAPVVTPEPAPAPTQPAHSAPSSCPAATVTVSSAAQLQSSLDHAKPGDVIVVAPGTYKGEFDTRQQGTSAAPIWLCGDGATLVGDGIQGGEVLSFNRAAYWNVTGLALTDGQTGLEVKASAHISVKDVTISHIGDEGAVVKYGSADTLLDHVTVNGSGARRDRNGWAVVVTDSARTTILALAASNTPAGIVSGEASATGTVIGG